MSNVKEITEEGFGTVYLPSQNLPEVSEALRQAILNRDALTRKRAQEQARFADRERVEQLSDIAAEIAHAVGGGNFSVEWRGQLYPEVKQALEDKGYVVRARREWLSCLDVKGVLAVGGVISFFGFFLFSYSHPST